ncbi:hypothetical protein Taro_026594 [Colocasia esculenta]|uniref:U-box domain-containing protein n=1 Tax=Colocasia esculenta TaxID=4460 RepID=A0A843VL24_COLES|nr:hypothetical protein [Colocasia esculenta]
MDKPHQTTTAAMADEAPLFFRCPISMEIMQDPVTVSTGVTYERKNIHKWLFTYKKKTCPATMQRLDTIDLIPNHTLHRLINSWSELGPASQSATPSSSAPPTPSRCYDVRARLAAVDSAPFKVSSLRKIRAEIAMDEEAQMELTSSGGIEVLGRVVLQILVEGNDGDFAAFQACEEALGVLYLLPLSDEASVQLLSRPECLRAMTVILQRGGAEARLHAVTILQRVAGAGGSDFWAWLLVDSQDNVEFIKSLLELLSDESTTKAGACALDVLLDVLGASKKSRVRAVELGATHLLVELLPEANRHCCERMLLMLKMLCECPEGRMVFAEHGLGIAVVSKKILRVSDLATKLGVKVLWLVCSFLPTEKVLDEMMAFGAVKKLLVLLHVDGRTSTKEKAINIIKQHAGVWRKYPCFPCELKGFLKLVHACH